jgi:DNA modification methylase
VDGFHRWKAHLIAGLDKINVEIIETASEKELKKLAYQLNSSHGLSLSPDEKKKYAQEMIGDMTVKEISGVLSVSESTVKSWTASQRTALIDERNRKILESYLRAWNTLGSIAEENNIDEKTVDRIIAGHFDKSGEMSLDFKPQIYNIWNTPRQDHETNHFGSFPQVFMENLLYYHTKPRDIVYDPFAGAGTTINACKKMLRRYYCTDRIVKPGREADIKQHDINTGLPEMQKPGFVFLDPPYWRQAKGKYSDDSEDLGNMSLDDFYKAMRKLLGEIEAWKVKTIALVIQPTQYSNDEHVFEDHIFEFDKLLPNYKIEMRYILPYSSEQYNAQIVTTMKDEKKCMVLNRDLVVWSLNK